MYPFGVKRRAPYGDKFSVAPALTGLSGLTSIVIGEPGYWIDANTGNDTTGNGSAGAPWLTLSKALSVAIAGDIINCRSGVYYAVGSLTAAQNNLTIRAGNGQTPQFSHANLYSSGAWSKTGGRTNVYQAAYTAASCWYVWNGASGSTILTSVADVATCDATPNSRFFDDPGNLLYINIGGDVPTTIYVEQSNANMLTCSGTGQIIDGLTVQWSMQAGINVTGTNTTVRNCVGRYWGQFGGNPFAPFHLNGATNPTISACTAAMTYTNAGDVGIGITNGSGATVSGCTVTDANVGIKVTGSTGVTITGNTVTHAKFDAIECSAGTITVSYNTVVNPMTHGGITLDTTTSTATVHHNLVYWNTASAGSLYGYINHATAGSFYHNVAANGTDASATTTGFLMAAGAGNTGTYYNNIAYKCATGFGYTNGTLVSDYNNANGNSSSNFGAGWTAGAHSITTDPLFTDQANDVYTLQTGSPCIDAGVAIGGINDGYLGAAPDIGYVEKA